MKRFSIFLTLFVWMCWGSEGWAQTEFPVGILTFEHGDTLNLYQFDSLNIKWVQGRGGQNNSPTTLESNTRGLSVISRRENIHPSLKAQRLLELNFAQMRFGRET